jgi:YidC/Oxa1 family membrane protein insertase
VFDAILGFLDVVLMQPLYWLISAVLVGCHALLSTFMDPAGGAAWGLSIVGLTLVVRAATIPLFVKQIKSSRNLQLLAPQLRELQKKYAHDKEKLQQETMTLYRDTGTNPFSSCFPILVQMPIFIALFQLLSKAARTDPIGHGFMTSTLAEKFGKAELWGISISDTFRNASGDVRLQVVIGVMVLLMVATTFYMQKQLMAKNMPPEALEGPAAQTQKIMLYVLPLGFLFSGYAFQVGLLIYMVVSNLWTLGQQFWVIRNNPTPNSEAFRLKQERDIRKGKITIDPADLMESEPESEIEVARVQPKKTSRKSRKQGSSS